MGQITSRSRRLSTTIGLWVLQVFLALGFISNGLMTLVGAPPGAPGWGASIFFEIGGGQWLRYTVGLIEIAAALGLLIPLLAAPTAIGLTMLMAAATVPTVLIGYDPRIPFGVAVMSALVLYGRWQELTALPDRLRRLVRRRPAA